MAELTVSGQVLYNDLTPADGVMVTVRDLDGLDGQADDLILQQLSDAYGRFHGAGNWKDREGRIFGIDVPDILRLVYTATVDGRTYDGPFLRLDDARSAPIILPQGPRKPVDKSKRNLVQIILVSNDYTGGEKTLYQFIELATETLTRKILSDSYRSITFVKGADATLHGLTSALVAAGQPAAVEAVDLIFSTHGSSNQVILADGIITEDSLRDALLTIAEPVRQKFRICFSTACYGATHIDTWRAAGFSDASGAKGIYADSAVSYAPFLAAWAAGRSFAEAVSAANLADINDVADQAARRYYDSHGQHAAAAAIDSTRVRQGSGVSRIYTRPRPLPTRPET